MNIEYFYTIILLIFVWLVGATITIVSLYCDTVLMAILGIIAPYYLTKYLLIENKNDSDQE